MVFAITNQKGGVGKTTTSLNIGVFLAKKGNSVLLVDIDPQANLTSGLGIETSGKPEETKIKTTYDLLINNTPIEETIQKTRINDLYIAPSGIELAGAEVELVSSINREGKLQKAIEPVKDKYDVILIDCPPSLGLLTVNGQVAADKVLIPVQTEYFALEGLGQLINTVKLVKNNLNTSLDIGGVILTMFDTRTNLSKDVAVEIKNFFKEKLFDTFIPRNVKLSEAPSHGLSILEYAPESTGASAYNRLTDEMIRRFNLKNNGSLELR